MSKIPIMGRNTLCRKKSKLFKFLILTIIISSLTLQNFAQSRIINGTVKDKDGIELIGVTVKVKGIQRGTSTDATGKFSLNTDENSILIFSYLGYLSKEVNTASQNTLNVILDKDTKSLEEIVVVGYGTVKKSDLTGTVTSLRADDFNKSASASINQLMAGKAAGVRIVQNSNEPGGGISVNIRGAGSVSAGTSPLYVIDGLPLSNTPAVDGSGKNYTGSNTERSPLNAVNPSDIESIEILKDASATAIYGSRGANGVVIITTKSGKQGRTKVGYSGYYGIQNVSNKLRVLSPEEYMTVLNDIIDHGGGTVNEKVTGIENGGTDWQDAIYKNDAGIQSHNLSITGGSEKSTFFVGLNYFNQKGSVVTSALDRYTARINFTNKISDKFDVGFNINTSYNLDNFAPEGTGFNENGGTIYAAINMDPTISVFDETSGAYERSPFISIDNPLALVYGKRANSSSYRNFGTIYGNYHVIPGLTAKLNIGGDILNQRRDVYVDRTTTDGKAANGVASILNGATSNYVVEGTVTYDKTFGMHKLNFLAGATTQRFLTNRNSLNASGFTSDGTLTNSVGSGTQSTFGVGSTKIANRLISYLGRVNYTLQDKYLLTASFRTDGSSRFGKNNRFGYFPSFAGAWKIKQENFLKNVEAISDLKLKASWGQTGNQSIPDYQSFETYGNGPKGVFNGAVVSTQEPARLANPDLKWETTVQTNFGFELGLLKNRINLTADYYTKKTTDMLIDKPVSTTSGFATQLTNIGSIKNNGLEFSLDARIIDHRDFKWNASGNIATIKNKVLDIGGADEIVVGAGGVLGGAPAIIRPGEPLYTFYGYNIIGVWQKDDDFTTTKDNVKPGDFKYEDINGDGFVDNDDRVLLGNSFPSLSWGFSSGLSYKKLSLDFQVEGVHGVKMFNNNLADVYFPINFRRNKIAEPYLNRWTETNPSNVYPSFITPLSQGQKLINSYTVEDASYIRLQTVTLSYKLPALNKVIKSGMVYITGQNLFTITDYTGFDPAVNPNGNANFRVDFNAYPPSRTFLLGLNFDF